ncbi:MAG TPA: 30S ribosomal protein S6 [Thermodesulfovibrionales bacterium]|nr:30S ribosomal protein S6 [Thermodesulfovibrionales bacterium]
MNIYENIVILNASLSDEELEAASGKIKDLITNAGGELLKVEVWGRRKLAYEVRKHKKGFYLFLLFRSASSFIKKLEDYYKVYDPVIKYMVIKLDKKMMKGVVLAKPEDASVPKGEGSPAESPSAAAATTRSEV